MATVNELAVAFLDHCVETKKPATVIHYRKRLKPFLARFGSREFGELLPMEILGYMRDVNRFPAGHKRAGQPKANSTRASNAIVLELLEAFAVEMRAIPATILPTLEKPIGGKREELPTDADVKAILKLASPAFALIYRALRQTGCRPSELVEATFADWHQADNEIVLLDHKTATKTGDPRRISIGKRFGAMLATATSGRTEGPLFLNTLGQPWTVEALSRNFTRLRKRAGLRSCLVLYHTRHEFATKLCDAVGVEETSKALNHRKLDTTMRYVHTNRKKQADNQDLIDGAADAA